MTSGDNSVPERRDEAQDPTTGGPKSFGLGRYVVRQVLGEGAQKIVYLVRDTSLGRDCALSLLKTEHLERDAVTRMRREAQTVARLTHANITTVHDISGEDEPLVYIVSEYVAGGDLRSTLGEVGRALPTRRAIQIAKDVCRALGVAHRNGVIHRDLKPENIWLTEDGSAKLGDFGFALDVERTRLTAPGSSAAETMMRTAAYMAPEQAQGQEVTARSDLYSLGCVLYEMLAGRPPFEGDEPLAVVAQHVAAEPRPLREQNEALPQGLDGLVLRLLEKDPAKRPASADDILAELETIEALPLPPQSRPGTGLLELLARPAVRIVAAALLLTVVGGGVAAAVLLGGGGASSAATMIANYTVEYDSTGELLSGTDCETEDLAIHLAQVGDVTGDIVGQEVTSVDVDVSQGCGGGSLRETSTFTDADGNSRTSVSEGTFTLNAPDAVSELTGTFTGGTGIYEGATGTFSCHTISRDHGVAGDPDYGVAGRSECQSEVPSD